MMKLCLKQHHLFRAVIGGMSISKIVNLIAEHETIFIQSPSTSLSRLVIFSVKSGSWSKPNDFQKWLVYQAALFHSTKANGKPDLDNLKAGFLKSCPGELMKSLIKHTCASSKSLGALENHW